MTKRQRTLLFLSLLGLFLVLAPSLVLYSQGYRIDFANKKITQTGAFYFKVSPPRADISVDGKLVKRTDFLFGSALTKNFFPANYLVEITKEGYQPWQKILNIAERSVKEAKNVLLFKQDPQFQTLADNVQRAWVSPDRKYALLLQKEPRYSWELELANLNTGGTETLIGQEDSQKSEVLDIAWAPNSKRFLLKRMLAEQIVSEVRSISSDQPCFKKPCTLEHLGGGIGNIRFAGDSSDSLLFTKFLAAAQVLFLAEYQAKEAPVPFANNVVAFASKGNTITWLDREGALWQKDLTADTQTQIIQEPAFTPKRETPYALTLAGNSVLLQESSSLFLHEPGTALHKEILSPVLELAVSADHRKVALHNNSELWVLFLKEETEQPKRQAGELVLLTRSSQTIGQISWIDSSHLLFSLGDKVLTMEIDNRNRPNTAELGSFSEPKLFWDNEKGTLSVLSKGALFVSEKLIR